MDYVLVTFSVLIAAIGIFFTIYFGLKNKELEKERSKLEEERSKREKERKTLTWQDSETASIDLSKEIKRDFTPDIIFTPDIRGGTIANMIKTYLCDESSTIPVMVGMLVWRDAPDSKSSVPNYFEPFYHICETRKWHAYVPKEISHHKDKKILIIDDFVLTGELGSKLKETLIGEGFKKDSIKFAGVIATESAIEGEKPPDYYWKRINHTVFYFPWGEGK